MNKLKPSPKLNSGRQILLRSKLIRACLNSVEENYVVCVKGGLLSGKTVFLNQLKAEIGSERETFLIELKSTIPLTDFRSHLSKLLKTENIFEYFEQKSTIVFIDNAERILGFDEFIREFSEHAKDSRLVLSSIKNLVDSSFDLIPLSDAEILEMITSFGFRFSSPSKRKQFLTQLRKATNGVPIIVKIFLSHFKIDPQFLIEVPELCFQNATRASYEQLLERLSERIVLVLKSAGLVHVSSDVESRVLSVLLFEELLDLRRLNLLSYRKDLCRPWLLVPEFKQFLCSTTIGSSFEKTCREKILSSCLPKASLEERRERVIQLRELSAEVEFKEELEGLIQELHQQKSFSEIIAQTDQFWKTLSPATYETRRLAMLDHQRFDDLIVELLFRFENGSSVDRPWFAVALCRTYYWKGNLIQAQKYITEAIAMSEPDSAEFYYASVFQSRILRLSNPPAAYKLIHEAVDKIAIKFSSNQGPYVEALFEAGHSAQFLGRYQEAIEHYRLCTRVGNPSRHIVVETAQFNMIDSQFRAGLIREALSALESLRGNYAHLRAHLFKMYAEQTNIRHKMIGGLFDDAENGWFQLYNVPAKVASISQYDQLYLLFQIYLSAGNFSSAHRIKNLLLNGSAFSKEEYYSRCLSRFYSKFVSITDEESFREYLREFTEAPQAPYSLHEYVQAIYFSLESAWRRGFKLTLLDFRNLDIHISNAPQSYFKRFYYILRGLYCQNGKADKENSVIETLADWAEMSHLPLWSFRSNLVLAQTAYSQSDFPTAKNRLKKALAQCRDVHPDSTDAEVLRDLTLKIDNSKLSERIFKLQDMKVCQLTLELLNRRVVANNQMIDMNDRDVIFRLLKFLSETRSSPSSKEAIARALWNEEYNPLVHDTRIYTNIKRLRRTLEPILNRPLLNVLENGYLLSSEINVHFNQAS